MLINGGGPFFFFFFFLRRWGRARRASERGWCDHGVTCVRRAEPDNLGFLGHHRAGRTDTRKRPSPAGVLALHPLPGSWAV